tara:strand:+ start:17004 stop:19352 length:2349 start_codon:yes stop_codon:yes gene_type:complete
MYDKNTKAHIFNIDNLLIRLPQQVWIIEKNNPNKCLLRIPKEDYDLIKTGVHKVHELSMTFNGRTYWLSKDIFEKLKKSVKALGSSEELSFSFREYTDPETIQDLKVEYDLSPIEHLKNLNDDIFFISTKGTEKRYGQYYTKLVDKLKEEGLLINQIFYLNQSYFSQSKDKNIKKICYIILSNLLNREITDNELGDTIDDDKNYDELYYYDTNYVTINKIDAQVNSFLRRLGTEDKDNKCKLFLNLVGSNNLKPFTSTEVKLNKYLKTFETFDDGSLKKKVKSDITIGDDYEADIKLIKSFLDKNNIDYNSNIYTLFAEYVITNNDGSLIKIKLSKTPYNRRSVMGTPQCKIVFYDKIRSFTDLPYGEGYIVDNLNDIINFISKYMPEIITNNIFRKINEGISINSGLTPIRLEEFLNKNNIDFGIYRANKRGTAHNYVRYMIRDAENNKAMNINFYLFMGGNMRGSYEMKDDVEMPEGDYERIHIDFFHNNKTSSYLSSLKKFLTINDLINFISENMPELVNNKVFKKLNEGFFKKKEEPFSINSDLTTKSLEEFLNKNNIKFETHVFRGTERYDGTVKYTLRAPDNKHKVITIKFFEYKKGYDKRGNDRNITIQYYDYIDITKGNGYQDATHINSNDKFTLTDLIKIISENMPELVTNKVFRKLNESNSILTKRFITDDNRGTVDTISNFFEKSGIKTIINPIGDETYSVSILSNNSFLSTKFYVYVLDNGYRDISPPIDSMVSGSATRVNCLMDIINYISEHMPELVNNKVFKKLNKSE